MQWCADPISVETGLRFPAPPVSWINFLTEVPSPYDISVAGMFNPSSLAEIVYLIRITQNFVSASDGTCQNKLQWIAHLCNSLVLT